MNRTALYIAGGVLSLLSVQMLALYFFGQPTICECGYVRLWEGVVRSSGNSQHLSDWYTFSHVLHGFLFYALLWYLFPRFSHGSRLFFALAIEVGWEVLENTPMVINHYRQQALAQGYVGDSILNSLSDSLWMLLGFLFARFSPLWITIILAIVMEVFVAYAIRDNLALNIINLIHIFPWIESWQAGA